jgi:hypothetical protein
LGRPAAAFTADDRLGRDAGVGSGLDTDCCCVRRADAGAALRRCVRRQCVDGAVQRRAGLNPAGVGVARRSARGQQQTSATQSISEIGAFGIGGWLVQLLSGPGAILVDAVSFLASAVLLRSVAVNETAPATEVRSAMRLEIVAGLDYVWHQPLLRTTALASMALWFGDIFGTSSACSRSELGFEAGPLA